jgi:hypothetical protein
MNLHLSDLAWRNLAHDKVRLAITLTGIVFAVVLIVVELGLFLGFLTTTSGLIDRSLRLLVSGGVTAHAAPPGSAAHARGW